MIQLTDSVSIKRKLPLNLAPEDNGIFNHEISKEIDAVHLIELNDIIYTGTGLVQVSQGQKLPTPFLLYNFIQRLPRFYFLLYKVKSILTGKYKAINEPVVFVADQWSYGYFHWMAEALPRLMAGRMEITNSPVILPAKYKNLSFVKASLRQLGFNYVFLDEKKIYGIKHLQFISHFAASGNFNDAWLSKLRDSFQPGNKNLSGRKRVYISRKHTKRSIINEESITPLLKSLGFEIIYAEQLSFTEQQNLFTATEILLSNHGAGLTNMLFMQQGTKIVEIRNENDSHNNCYFSLASALNISYYYLKASPVETNEDSHNWNLTVDAFRLESILENILKG